MQINKFYNYKNLIKIASKAVPIQITSKGSRKKLHKIKKALQ